MDMIANYVSVASGKSPLAGLRLSGRAAQGAAKMISCFVERRVLWDQGVQPAREDCLNAAQEVRKLADAITFQVGGPKELVSALYNLKRAARIFVTADRTNAYHRDPQYFADHRAALVDTCGRELLALSVAAGVSIPNDLLAVITEHPTKAWKTDNNGGLPRGAALLKSQTLGCLWIRSECGHQRGDHGSRPDSIEAEERES